MLSVQEDEDLGWDDLEPEGGDAPTPVGEGLAPADPAALNAAADTAVAAATPAIPPEGEAPAGSRPSDSADPTRVVDVTLETPAAPPADASGPSDDSTEAGKETPSAPLLEPLPVLATVVQIEPREAAETVEAATDTAAATTPEVIVSSPSSQVGEETASESSGGKDWCVVSSPSKEPPTASPSGMDKVDEKSNQRSRGPGGAAEGDEDLDWGNWD